MISLENITKTAGKKRILDTVNAEFPEKAFSLLTAKKDNGKTTLCRILAGELLPDSGKIIKKNGSLRAFADEEGDFFPEFTVSECREMWNLLYPSFDDETFDRLTADTDITSGTKIHNLSKETKKWLKISLVLSSNAEIMIFDDPALDIATELKDKLLNLLKESAENGKCVIVAAEETGDFESLATNIFVLNNGDIVLASEISGLLSSHRLLPGATTISPDYDVVGPVFNERLVKTTDDIGRNATLKEIITGYINGSSS